MKIQKVSFASISLCIVILTTTTVQAEGDTRKRKAAEFFQKGEILFDSKEFAKAAQAFQLAYDMSPHPAVLANIAVSYDKAGKAPEAVTTYRLYLPHAGSSKEDKKMRRRLKKLEAQVGELDIQCSVTPCTIQVGGIAKEAEGTMVVLPGSYEVTASSQGHKDIKKTVSVPAGRVMEVHLTLEASPVEAAVPPPGPPEPETSEIDDSGTKPVLGIPFWVATGTTGAAVVVTVIFGVRTSKFKSDFESSGKTDTALKEKGESNRLITNIMMGVTAGAAVAAISLAIYDVVKAKKNKKSAPKRQLSWLGGPALGLGAAYSF